MKRKLLKASPELLVQWFQGCDHSGAIVRSDFPKDGRIVGCEWGESSINFVIESEAFEPVAEGEFPALIVRFTQERT